MLTDLRLLTNYTMDSEHRLCLLLVGLTELRRRLTMAVHESLSQRLVVRHHLGACCAPNSMTTSPTACTWPAAKSRCFEPPAAEALFHASRGLPQLINRIAHYALSACALANEHRVTAEHLQHALDELRP